MCFMCQAFRCFFASLIKYGCLPFAQGVVSSSKNYFKQVLKQILKRSKNIELLKSTLVKKAGKHTFMNYAPLLQLHACMRIGIRVCINRTTYT